MSRFHKNNAQHNPSKGAFPGTLGNLLMFFEAMNKFEKLEEANEKLFDSPLKNPLNSKDLQEDWGNKIILIGKQYPKKSWIGIVFISTIANEKEVNGYILTIKDGKPIKHFIVAKYKGLNVLADYNQL